MDHPPLYILRHGQTRWNAEHRFQGGLDSPLTELGRHQAVCQRRILAARDLRGFRGFSSPQGRAFVTAALVLEGLLPRIDTDPRLREIGIGAWEGAHRRDIQPDGPVDESEESALSLYTRAPGGEGFAALRRRCVAFLGDLAAPAVVVTHGITSRMLRLVLLGMDTAEIGALPGGQGVVFHIENGVQTKLSIGA